MSLSAKGITRFVTAVSNPRRHFHRLGRPGAARAGPSGGYDRGARVAHRLALDYPGAVTRLAVLDIVPTRHVLTT
jgi:hypothetical protein